MNTVFRSWPNLGPPMGISTKSGSPNGDFSQIYLYPTQIYLLPLYPNNYFEQLSILHKHLILACKNHPLPLPPPATTILSSPSYCHVNSCCNGVSCMYSIFKMKNMDGYWLVGKKHPYKHGFVLLDHWHQE